MCLVHRLHPHCLPDAAHRSVPYGRVDDALLSAWLHAVVGRIEDLDREGLLAGLLEIWSDVV